MINTPTHRSSLSLELINDSLALVGIAALLFAAGCSSSQQGFLEASEQGDLSYGTAPRQAFDQLINEQCGDGSYTQLGVDYLTRRPYLQQVTANSAEVLWTSGDQQPAQIIVTLPDGTLLDEPETVLDTSANPLVGQQYVSRITGLPANSMVCYELITDNGALTERMGFHTAPETGADTPVRFLVFGDLGTQSGDQIAVLDQMSKVAFDFALLAGDIAYDDGKRAELERNVFEVYHHMMARVPFFPASGNHDYHTEDAAPFREAFSLPENGGPEGLERWYSFDWGNVHVAVIDTEVLSDTQSEWLDADLAASTGRWNIVVGHRPPYSSGSHGSDPDIRAMFQPIFERHAVDIAFFGHEHNYERTQPINNIPYIVTGGAGRGTRPVGKSAFTAFSAQVAHFTYVVATEDSLTMHAIDATGADFDSVRVEK